MVCVSSTFSLYSILVSTFDFHSADLGLNPVGGENSTKGFIDSDSEVLFYCKKRSSLSDIKNRQLLNLKRKLLPHSMTLIFKVG